MAYGIISSGQVGFSFKHFDLHLRHPQLPATLELSRAFTIMGIQGDAEVALRNSISHPVPAHRLPAFTDVIGLWCEWLPIQGIQTNVLDNPFPFPLTTMGERPESRNVWRSVLKEQEATLSDPRKQVLQFYDSWIQGDPEAFTQYHRIRSNRAWMAFFKDAFDITSAYLTHILGKGQDGPLYIYNQDGQQYLLRSWLVGCHVTTNAHSLQQAEENIKTGHDKTRDSDSLPQNRDPVFTERAYIYAENVPQFVERMKKSQVHDHAKNIAYEDVWWLMMMRLHAWTMSVQWVDRGGIQIPSEYYDNSARVYIL
jgi:hypothetical protein